MSPATRRWIYLGVAVAIVLGLLLARREAVEIRRVEVVAVFHPQPHEPTPPAAERPAIEAPPAVERPVIEAPPAVERPVIEAPPAVERPASETPPAAAAHEEMTHFRLRLELSRSGHVAVLAVDPAGAVVVAWPPPEPRERAPIPAGTPSLIPPPEEVPWPLPDLDGLTDLVIAASSKPISRRELVEESSILVRGVAGRTAIPPLVRSLLESRVGPARIVRVGRGGRSS